jgi:DNA-binding MarR family transcriptional regulator
VSRDRARDKALEDLGRQLGALAIGMQALSTETALRFHPSLPPSAFHIARWLATFGPARVADVADGVSMDRAAVSRLVGGLRMEGLVTAAPDARDRRALSVSITPAGRRHVTRALDWKETSFYGRLSTWSTAELTRLAELLGRLNGDRS